MRELWFILKFLGSSTRAPTVPHVLYICISVQFRLQREGTLTTLPISRQQHPTSLTHGPTATRQQD